MPEAFPSPAAIEIQPVFHAAKNLFAEKIRNAAAAGRFSSMDRAQDAVLHEAQPCQVDLSLQRFIGAEDIGALAMQTHITGLYRPSHSFWQKLARVMGFRVSPAAGRRTEASLDPNDTFILLRNLPPDFMIVLIRYAYAKRYEELLQRINSFPPGKMPDTLQKANQFASLCDDAIRRMLTPSHL